MSLVIIPVNAIFENAGWMGHAPLEGLYCIRLPLNSMSSGILRMSVWEEPADNLSLDVVSLVVTIVDIQNEIGDAQLKFTCHAYAISGTSSCHDSVSVILKECQTRVMDTPSHCRTITISDISETGRFLMLGRDAMGDRCCLYASSLARILNGGPVVARLEVPYDGQLGSISRVSMVPYGGHLLWTFHGSTDLFITHYT